MTGRPTDPDPVGTVAEEAAKLLALLGQRASERPSPEPDRHAGSEEHHAARLQGADPGEGDTCREHPRAGEALTCALCPICQGIALLRTLNPQTVDRLADLATAAAAALRELAVSTAAQASRPTTRASEQGRPEPAARPARGRTVGIEVLDEEETP